MIEWSAPIEPNEECPYDHVYGETKWGRFRIEWKSWKDYPGYSVDFEPAKDGFVSSVGTSLGDAKLIAARWLASGEED